MAGDLVPTLREHAHEVDVRAEFPTASLRALRESGLMGLMVPSEYGGLNGTPQDLAEFSQVLAGGCLSTAMIFVMHCQQADALVRFARHELKERLLPRIADGSLYLASITSEEDKGGHLLTSAAPSRSVDGGLRVSRVAPVVTGGAHADGYLVTMRSGPEAPAHAVSLVYVDRRQADLEFHGDWDPMGMRGTHSVGLKLEAVVPPEQIVGTEGEFRAVALHSFMPLAHIGWSACWLGAA
ncbi:acyl-CoA dehydrogenase family protein [Streptomyces sp. TE33382]